MAGNREQTILEAYEAWNPDESTVSELVDSLSISRQRLYQVLDRHGIVPKTHRKGKLAERSVHGDLMEEMARMALGYLLNELTEARSELGRYRAEHGPLSHHHSDGG